MLPFQEFSLLLPIAVVYDVATLPVQLLVVLMHAG